MMKMNLRRNIRLCLILFVILISVYSVAGESEWIWYNGHDMRFEYPSNWGLINSSTGVIVEDNQTFALSIVMHKEGCYPLSQHPQLLDFMLKLWNKEMDGTPWGDPITQYGDTSIGPYSISTQLYKNPYQALSCELQGYTTKNVTISFALINMDPINDSAWGKTVLDIARLRKSLNVTLSGNQTSFI
jgi:hypothetical protein